MNVLLDTTKSNFESQARFFFSYLVHCDALLQNVTDIIIKCDDSFITKCDSHYKLPRLLQNTSIHSMTVILLCLVFSFSFPKLFFSNFPLRNFFMTTSLFNPDSFYKFVKISGA